VKPTFSRTKTSTDLTTTKLFPANSQTRKYFSKSTLVCMRQTQ